MRILQSRICLSTACHLGPRVPIYRPGVRSALDTAGATRRSPARCPVVECQNRWFNGTSQQKDEWMGHQRVERQRSRGGRHVIMHWVPPRSATRVHRSAAPGEQRTGPSLWQLPHANRSVYAGRCGVTAIRRDDQGNNEDRYAILLVTLEMAHLLAGFDIPES